MDVLSRRERGLIPLQEAEVITLRNGAIADVRRVVPTRTESWLRRQLKRLARLFAPVQEHAFFIGESEDVTVPVAAKLLNGRDSFCLIDGTAERPRLNLLPGMRGEITIGAASLSADQMLRDPGLRRAEGDSSYALPNGAQARIRCGRLTFLIRCVAPEAPAYSPV
jgi:hypothetical protein